MQQTGTVQAGSGARLGCEDTARQQSLGGIGRVGMGGIHVRQPLWVSTQAKARRLEKRDALFHLPSSSLSSLVLSLLFLYTE
jgi:hypothetical protein